MVIDEGFFRGMRAALKLEDISPRCGMYQNIKCKILGNT
jgi:hypothetical protein